MDAGLANNFPFVHKPLKHQEREFNDHLTDKGRALIWDPGVGKSKTAIDRMAYLYMTDEIDTVIIMAKKGEYTNWTYVELPEHMPHNLEYESVIYRSGLKELEKERIRRLVKSYNKLRILNINIESMTFEGGQLARAFAASAKKGFMFILDESTCVKNHKNARSKEVVKLARKAKYRIIMTGTFATQSPLDVWGQALVLGDGLLGTTSFYAFKSEYCVEQLQHFGARSFKKIVGYKNLDRLNEKIRTFASIVERSEAFDLPPKIYKKTAVELTDEQMSHYTSMRNMAIAEFKDDVIVEATNALDIMSKLDQIAVGQIKLEDGSFRILNNNRVEALLTKLEGNNKRGIIWCNYRGMLEHLYEALRKEYGTEKIGRYYGGIRDDEREETLADFKNPEGKIQWIVANQRSLGFGHTLIHGKENHYFSNGYSLELRLQSEDRTMRLGQTDSVLYEDYFAPDTVNEKIFVALRAKRNMMSEILGTSIRKWI